MKRKREGSTTGRMRVGFMAPVVLLLAALAGPTIADSSQAPASAILLTVDATDVSRGIFQVRETVPVTRAGRLVLRYPVLDRKSVV